MSRLLTLLFACLCLCVPAFAQEAAHSPAYEGMTISNDIAALPAPVRETRQKLLDAAASGNIEALRPIIAAQATPPTVSFGEPEDPIAYLKGESSDKEGRQVMGILKTLLEAPYAIFDSGEDDGPTYVWPYLAMGDSLTMTPGEEADARAILGEAAFKDFKDLESWFYWRVFMDEHGEWTAFVAGD